MRYKVEPTENIYSFDVVFFLFSRRSRDHNRNLILLLKKNYNWTLKPSFKKDREELYSCNEDSFAFNIEITLFLAGDIELIILLAAPQNCKDLYSIVLET